MKKKPKKLLDQVRDTIRLKHYSIRTERSYVDRRLQSKARLIFNGESPGFMPFFSSYDGLTPARAMLRTTRW